MLALFAGLLFALGACSSRPAATPAAVTTETPSPTIIAPVDTPTSTPPTSTLAPTAMPIETSVPACPPAGDPLVPTRPASFEQYAATLTAYLNAGASKDAVEDLLSDWEAMGQVEAVEMTGDSTPETVILLVDPSPEVDWVAGPAGDLLVYHCQEGAVRLVYQGRAQAAEDWEWFSFELDATGDATGDMLDDVVYRTRTCGAHTCFEQLHVAAWDGASLSNVAAGMEAYPYPTFELGEGQVLVDVGGIGSAGAGVQRSYREVWTWDGARYALREAVVGPPVTLIHFVHDGDEALALGDYEESIEHYRNMRASSLSSGLVFVDDTQRELAIVNAYNGFKLMVAHAASGETRDAETELERLRSDHPPGTPGDPFAVMADAFWAEFEVYGDAGAACAAAVAVSEGDPDVTELLYAGYANPEYTAEGLCRLP
ncbi:hypothetical protein ACFLWA_11520 [Chloroflexota bacterium]